jgi:hypothetical protein
MTLTTVTNVRPYPPPGVHKHGNAPASTGTAASAAVKHTAIFAGRTQTSEEVCAEIAEIYRVHNPAKLPDVPRLLRKYVGRETAALATIQAKYGVAPAGVGGHSVMRREIEKLLTVHHALDSCHEMLSRVGELAATHGEEKLLAIVREQVAARPAPTKAPRTTQHVEAEAAVEAGRGAGNGMRRRYGGVVLSEVGTERLVAFKMQMKMTVRVLVARFPPLPRILLQPRRMALPPPHPVHIADSTTCVRRAAAPAASCWTRRS